MAEIIWLSLTQQPSSVSSGAMGPTHTAIWYAETDEGMPADLAMQLAAELVGGPLPSSNPDGTKVVELPNPGDRLFWTSDQLLVPDEYSLGITGVNEFLADGNLSGDRYYDAGARALDFSCQFVEPNCSTKFQFRVTYRPPRPGANEQPQQLIPLLQGRNGVGTPSEIDFANMGEERWIEQRSLTRETSIGYPVDMAGGGALGTKGPMKYPNDEEFPPQVVDSIQDILVISRNVASEGDAIRLNRLYTNTTNSDPVTVISGEPAQSPRTMLFESAKTGKVQTRSNNDYYRMEIRILLFNTEVYVREPAVGTFFYLFGTKTEDNRLKLEDKDGNVLDTCKLKSDGDEAILDSQQAEMVFLLQDELAYASEFGLS